VLAVCEGAPSQAGIMLNNGNASSWERIDLPLDFSKRGSFHSLGVADFDGDGDQDIFFADQEDKYMCFPPDGHPKAYVCENMGDNSFETHVVLDKDLGLHDARLGDIDNDGDIDIASHNWATWPQDGNGGKPHGEWLENTMGPFVSTRFSECPAAGTRTEGRLVVRCSRDRSRVSVMLADGAGELDMVEIRNAKGAVICRLPAGRGPAPACRVEWNTTGPDGKPAPAGLYVVRAAAGSGSFAKPFVYAR
jgi:hypothetical protein